MDDIYPTLIAYDKETQQYRLPINWGEVNILVKAHNSGILVLKKILPVKYRGIRFSRSDTLIDEQISLGNSTRRQYRIG